MSVTFIQLTRGEAYSLAYNARHAIEVRRAANHEKRLEGLRRRLQRPPSWWRRLLGGNRPATPLTREYLENVLANARAGSAWDYPLLPMFDQDAMAGSLAKKVMSAAGETAHGGADEKAFWMSVDDHYTLTFASRASEVSPD